MAVKERDLKILDFIKKFRTEKGYTPTTREICKALQIKSTSTVHAAMENLKEAGLINQDDRKHSYSVEDGSEFKEEIAQVPIVGRVAAGQPILAEQNIEGYFPIPAAQLAKGNCFMLSVHGNSMVEAGILNGDYILVQEQKTADNGDIVVAMVEGLEEEATVKAFYKEQGHIRLQPRNSEMDPIIVDDCTIVGKVKGVFRYLN